ncbi:MAG: DUF1015 domain-containing protein [Dehalococcoidia bacterium]|nr:DUF1015 domain-containing protein [Dehalococcoidia bacterium]MDH4291006.1 DUF1015 domain-containing protein [Dehalococcoidia bacterium]
MEVSPFRGIRYNQSTVGDLARVICPPYDVISPEQQRVYYKKSDYNAIRLEFPEPTTDRYERAAMTFQQWLKQGVLEYDSVSAFYLHEHQFKYSGKKMVRRGVIARVKLEPWGSGIFPHEETSSKAKSDRLQLMRACRANFSPLFCLYQDSEQKIAPTLYRVAQEKPLISLRAERGNFPDSDEAHSLWAVTDPEIKRELSELLSSQPIYIADGHHRYETALTYQQERTEEQSPTGKGAFNYVMMELVEFSDPGVIVLPLHRLVRGILPSSLMSLGDRLKDFFTVESVALRTGSWQLPVDSYLGILGLQPGSLVVLKKRQDVSLEAMMPGNRSQVYREFGVSILNHIVLDSILSGVKDTKIAYTVDVEEAHQQIREGQYQLAFLLHPPQPGMVKAVADAQDRMPRKSTYFYPKLPAGLVINPLD